MHPIVYVDGKVADDIGGMGLRALAQQCANMARKPIDVLVHGESRYHQHERITAQPEV